MEKCTWRHRTWIVVKRLILVLLILFSIGIKASGSTVSEPAAAVSQR